MKPKLRISMLCRKGGVGGVTSSVKNLLTNLQASGENVQWPDLYLPWPRVDIIHLHVNNPARVAQLAPLARLFGRRVVWTVHNNRLQAGSLPSHKQAVDRVDGVIFINKEVFDRNVPYLSKRTQCRLLTPIVSLDSCSAKKSARSDDKVKLLLYASKRSFEGGETYGIEWTLKNLDRIPSNWVFTIVDVQGHYVGRLPESPQVIHIPHAVSSFPEFLKNHDIYLRPTTTDGQSVAILESLSVGTPVVASDAVPRPPGVVLYRHLDEEDYLRAIRSVVENGVEKATIELSSTSDYMEFYSACLDRPD